MSFFSDFLANMKRYDDNAMVIFDQAEPIGRATDLVMPRRRWFGFRDRGRILRPSNSMATTEHS